MSEEIDIAKSYSAEPGSAACLMARREVRIQAGLDNRERIERDDQRCDAAQADRCIFEPDPVTKEMTVVSMHPGVTRAKIDDSTGWRAKYAHEVLETPIPTAQELAVLQELHVRTYQVHASS